MKPILAAFFVLLVLFFSGISITSASTHLPSANVPHSLDGCSPLGVCPPTPTPASNDQGAHSGDEDGDGIPDGIDQCPHQGGPSSNQGCPPDSGAAHVPVLPTLPTMPFTGECVLATRSVEGVNVRAEPSTHAAIVAELDPQTLYPVIAVLNNAEGIWDRIALGWVARRVVRLGGNCDALPMVDEPGAADTSPVTLAHPDGFVLTLDKGDTLGTDGAQGYCSTHFVVNFSKSDGSGNGVNFVFGDGSVLPAPEPLCIKLNADRQGFTLEPPPDPDKTHFVIDWHFAVDPASNGLTFFAILHPDPGVHPSTEADQTNLTLLWSFLPPPCKPADPTCQSSPENLTIHFDGTLSDPPETGKPRMLLSWEFLPPPCKSDDTSCPTQSTRKQGVFLNFLPAVQNDPLYFVVDWFPNGFDPSVGAFTQIENQPDGSKAGDPYGFIQIENQQFQGEATLRFSLPVVQ